MNKNLSKRSRFLKHPIILFVIFAMKAMSKAISFIFHFLLGENPDEKVMSESLRILLSNRENAQKVIQAIEKEKSGAEKEPTVTLNNKEYKLTRLSNSNVEVLQ